MSTTKGIAKAANNACVNTTLGGFVVIKMNNACNKTLKLDTIDAELRLLLAIRPMVREAEGRPAEHCADRRAAG
jgi:hypothetical protein